jgi:hypothetical protein
MMLLTSLQLRQISPFLAMTALCFVYAVLKSLQSRIFVCPFGEPIEKVVSMEHQTVPLAFLTKSEYIYFRAYLFT